MKLALGVAAIVALPVLASAQIPARTEFLGTGSPGTRGAPVLGLGGPPVTGEAFSFVVANGRSGSAGALYWSLARTELLLPPLGATLQLAGPRLLAPFQLDATGSVDGLAALTPVASNFAGLEVFAQALVLDPMAQGGLALTRGLGLRFGRPEMRAPFRRQVFPINPGSTSSRPVTGDFDGDGFVDIVSTVNSSTFSSNRRLWIVYGSTDGWSAPELRSQMSRGPAELSTGDFDGDGNLDVLVRFQEWTSISSPPQRLGLFRGLGDGSFRPELQTEFSTVWEMLEVGDVNGDGYDDVLGGVAGGSDVELLLGSATGLGSTPSVVISPGTLRDMALADMDLDGDLDLVVNNGGEQRFRIFHGDGNGAFALHQTFQVAPIQEFLVLADLDGDGYPEVTSKQTFSTGASVQVWKSDGSGGVLPTLWSSVPAIITRPHSFGDLSGDGVPDLFLPIGRVAIGQGDATFGTTSLVPTAWEARDSRVADVDGDGVDEVLCAGYRWFSVSHVRTVDAFDAAGLFVAVGDVDGNGVTDLLTAYPSLPHASWATVPAYTANVSVRLGRPEEASFGPPLDVPVSQLSELVWIGSTDLDDDGLDDLLLVDASTDELVLRHSLGDGSFGAPIAWSTGQDPVDARLGDWNADGRDDLVVLNEGSSTFSLFRGDAATGFVSMGELALANVPRRLEFEDFDGDGDDDLAVLLVGGDLDVRLSDGASFVPSQSIFVGPLARWIASGDIDSDGAVDLLAAIEGTVTGLKRLPGLGGGTFGAAAPFLSEVTSAMFVDLVDWTGDGDLDLLTTREGALRFHRGRGDGSFDDPRLFMMRPSVDYFDEGYTPTTPYGSSNEGTSLVAEDLDLDGLPDLVLGTSAVDVRVLYNRILR